MAELDLDPGRIWTVPEEPPHVPVWACSMVRDEEDVIGGTIRHLADEGVAGFVIADNLSTDGTRKLLEELQVELDVPLVIVDDPDPGYRQSEKMTALAGKAAALGAVWIVPFDADELWLFRGDRLAVELAQCDADVVTAELFNHFPSAVDPPGDDPFVTICWRQREPAPLPKVAFRWREGAVIDQGNHGVTFPGESPVVAAGLEVRHFPYRTAAQFVRKARNGAEAYAATDLPYEVGQHWRSYGALLESLGEEALHDVWRQYFWFLSPADAGLVHDPAPFRRWQLPAL